MPKYYALVFSLHGDPANKFISPRPPYIGTDRRKVEEAKPMARLDLLMAGVSVEKDILVIEDSDNFPTAEADGIPYPVSTLAPLFIAGPVFDKVRPSVVPA